MQWSQISYPLHQQGCYLFIALAYIRYSTFQRYLSDNSQILDHQLFVGVSLQIYHSIKTIRQLYESSQTVPLWPLQIYHSKTQLRLSDTCKNLRRQFLCDSHLTSVWSSGLVWSAFVSWQNCLKRRSHFALALIVLIHFLIEFKISFRTGQRFLEAYFLFK